MHNSLIFVAFVFDGLIEKQKQYTYWEGRGMIRRGVLVVGVSQKAATKKLLQVGCVRLEAGFYQDCARRTGIQHSCYKLCHALSGAIVTRVRRQFELRCLYVCSLAFLRVCILVFCLLDCLFVCLFACLFVSFGRPCQQKVP